MPEEPPRTTSLLPAASLRPQQAKRKQSPRPSKSGRKIPALSEAQLRLWADPEHRAKMVEARQHSAAERRKDVAKFTRLGVPDGMRKAEAVKLWDAARVGA